MICLKKLSYDKLEIRERSHEIKSKVIFPERPVICSRSSVDKREDTY